MTDEPLLQTGRFALWKPRAADLPALCALIADEDTRRYLGPASPEPQAQFERLMRNGGSWLLYGYGTLLVRLHGSDDMIASCGVFHSWRGFGAEKGMDDVPEAGWIVRRDWQGKGVAGEVMPAIMDWFDTTHGPRRVACMIEEGNAASERVAARLGFVRYDARIVDGTTINLFERIGSFGAKEHHCRKE